MVDDAAAAAIAAALHAGSVPYDPDDITAWSLEELEALSIWHLVSTYGPLHPPITQENGPHGVNAPEEMLA